MEPAAGKNRVDVRRMDAVFPGFNRMTPGISVLAAAKRKVVYERYAGLANLEHRIPIRKDTLFNLASISKPLTAAGIMLLVQKHRLNLDETISDYFPELKESCPGVCIRHLLSHTSGIHSGRLAQGKAGGKGSCRSRDISEILLASRPFERHPSETLFNYAYMKDCYGTRDVFEMFLASRPFQKYSAGTRFEYSNTGYVLLAMLIERVSGQSFPEFMQETVFLPFGMNHTRICDENRPVLPRRAWGYVPLKENGVYGCQQRLFYAVGPGSVFSTVRDLYRFWKTLMSDEIMERKWRELMWSDVIPLARKNHFYGYGWQIEYEGPLRKVGHAGTMEGFGNLLRFYPREEIFVCLLSNAGYRFSQDKRGICADAMYRAIAGEQVKT